MTTDNKRGRGQRSAAMKLPPGMTLKKIDPDMALQRRWPPHAPPVPP